MVIYDQVVWLKVNTMGFNYPKQGFTDIFIFLLLMILSLTVMVASEDIDRPANQQIRTIGMLYDARREQYLSRGIFTRPIQADEVTTITIEHQESTVKVTGNEDSTEDVLDLQGELGLSIAAGLVTGTLGGSFKKSKLDRANSVHGVATIKATTVKAFIDLCDDFLLPLIDPRAMQLKATHVVTGITYGAYIRADFVDENVENSNILEITGNLAGSISKFGSLLKGSLSGSLQHVDNDKKSKRNLKVSIQGDIGFQSTGMPVTEDEMFQFVRNLHLHLDVSNGKVGRPITYHLTAIDSEVASCIQNVTRSVQAVKSLVKIQDDLTSSIIEKFEQVKEMKTDVEYLWGITKSARHCIDDVFYYALLEKKNEFDSKIADFNDKMRNAIIKARSGNASLLEEANKDLFQNSDIRTAEVNFENKYQEYEDALNKLQFFSERNIRCVKRKHSIRNTVFQVSDSPVNMFLYKKQSITDDDFMIKSHELVDKCRIAGTACFVIDCELRKDKCKGYTSNSIIHFIRGIMEPSNLTQTFQNSSESLILSDFQSRIFNLERESRTYDKLINSIHRKQVHLIKYESELELQLNYTSMYQRMVFHHILDDVIRNETWRKYRQHELDRTPIGGLNVSLFCRPSSYNFMVRKLRDECHGEYLLGDFSI